MTAADQPTTEPSLHERIADTLAYYHCRAVNPKADHPRTGYHAMSEDQRQFLRARQDEAAAEVVRIIQSLAPAPQPAAEPSAERHVPRRTRVRYCSCGESPEDYDAVTAQARQWKVWEQWHREHVAAHACTERDERLRGIQERVRLASAGPWGSYSVPDGPGDPCHSVVEIGDHEVRLDWLHGSSLDANFIAAARTDVPWLLAEVARLDAVVTAVREALSGHPRCDQHADDDPVACGWKRAVADVQSALDGGAT